MVHEGRELVEFSIKEKFTDELSMEFKFERSAVDKKAWRVSTVVPFYEGMSPSVVQVYFMTYMSDQPVEDVIKIGLQNIIPLFIQAASDLSAVQAGLSKLL